MEDLYTTIDVSFQLEGIHRYPAAETIPGVEFLAYPHRHVFHFKATVEVFHDDRDIEFILLKRELMALYGQNVLEIDYMSCEMLARELVGKITAAYPGRNVTVHVSEDGENGASASYFRNTEDL